MRTCLVCGQEGNANMEKPHVLKFMWLHVNDTC